ncbi:hypothetical protein BGZ73_002565 [Actinomortierella ambigua]|nr:hypothetical protein BGZ73_002565 [Actinomortierella ambigua]
MSIAIARAEESGTQFEMVFYGARTYAKTIMDHILSFPCTSDIQRIPIGWAPTKILHVPLTMDLSEMAILVGGGDTKVHSFIKDESGNIAEQPTEDYFPILSTFHHSHNCILSMDVRDYPDFRVIAAGTQNGTLNVAIIPRDRATNELQHAKARNHSVILFSPITSLAIYTSRVRAMDAQGKALRHDRRDLRTSIASAEDDKSNNPDEGATEDVHLLMTCAIEQAWVYTAINRNGLAKRSEIAACGHHDSILTSYVMDIDWDGENELVIGTYGRQLMVFKQVHGYFVHQASGTSDAPLRYELYWNRRFAYPVYGISSADMNSDGLEELVITTMYGISFFQADSTAAKRRLAGAINKMAESERLKLRLERLRAENLQLESEAEEQMARIQTMEQAEIEAEEMAERAEEAKEHAGGAGEATAEQSGSLDIPDAQESRKEESSSVPSGQADEPSLQPKIDQSRHGDGCVLADSGDQISEASSERADRNEGDKEQPPESSASPQRGHFVPGPSEVVGANPESDAGSPSATSEPEHELKNDQQQSGGEPIERGYGSEHDTNQ